MLIGFVTKISWNAWNEATYHFRQVDNWYDAEVRYVAERTTHRLGRILTENIACSSLLNFARDNKDVMWSRTTNYRLHILDGEGKKWNKNELYFKSSPQWAWVTSSQIGMEADMVFGTILLSKHFIFYFWPISSFTKGPVKLKASLDWLVLLVVPDSLQHFGAIFFFDAQIFRTVQLVACCASRSVRGRDGSD